MRYESFVLRIEPVTDGAYGLAVQSPQGEGRGSFRLTPRGVQATTHDPVDGLRRDVEHRHVGRGPAPVLSADAGKDLFRAAFHGEAGNLLHASLGALTGRDKGLRISVAIDPRMPGAAPLLELPWELLCRPETEDVLCLSRRTPVVRLLEAHRERRPAPARPRRLRILVVAANPRDLPRLDLARERNHLEAAWRGRQARAEILLIESASIDEVRKALLAGPFHVFHFMGHATLDQPSGDGVLWFERADGTGEPITARHFARLLHDAPSLRLAFLNACHTADAVGVQGALPFSGAASALVMGGIPAVVAMSGPLPDDAAVAFSHVFYERLASGDPVEAAMTEGRLAIQRLAQREATWAIPILFLRAADGLLFAPRTKVWARRSSLLAGGAAAVALSLALGSGWLRARWAAEAARFVDQGIGWLEIGKANAAGAAFRSALKSEPGNTAARGNLAIVEAQTGDDEAALADAAAAANAAPREAVHQYNLGCMLAARRRYDEAIPRLRRAIELDPADAYPYNELGNVWLEIERPVEARRALEAGLKRDPKLANLHKNLARVDLVEGRVEEAIARLRTALPLYVADQGGKAEAEYWLAFAQAAAGHTAESCRALRDLAAVDPSRLSTLAKEAALLEERQRCTAWP